MVRLVMEDDLIGRAEKRAEWAAVALRGPSELRTVSLRDTEGVCPNS
jgi:hypothetical protein